MKLTNFRCYERGFARWCFKSKLRAETGPFRLVSAMCGVRGKFRGDQPTFDMALMFCFPPLLRKQQTFPFSSFSFYRRKYFSPFPLGTVGSKYFSLASTRWIVMEAEVKWYTKIPLHLKRKLPLCCLQSYIAHCASTKRNLIKRVNYRSVQQTQKRILIAFGPSNWPASLDFHFARSLHFHSARCVDMRFGVRLCRLDWALVAQRTWSVLVVSRSWHWQFLHLLRERWNLIGIHGDEAAAEVDSACKRSLLTSFAPQSG